MDQSVSTRKMAVITGAAVRLGRAIALALAERGYAIGLHYFRSITQARETAAQIEQLGAQVLLLQADLREPEQISAMFQQVAENSFPLSVLVNSAALMAREDLRSMPVEDWDATIAVNLRAPWLCAREAAALMEVEGGLIVNMSDTGAAKAWTGFPAYEVSKAGLEMLTRLLAKSLAPTIRVNAIAPGLILKADGMPDGEWQHLIDKTPLKKPGSPEAVVRALAFLIENRYITGETLVIDGGYQLI